MAKDEKNEKELLQDLNYKMDRLIALTATQGLERDEKIKVLTNMNYSNTDIYVITGIPKGTIDTIRAKLKGDASGKKSRKNK